MVPTDFDESNVVLDKPPDMTYDECDPVSVLRIVKEGERPIVISCWKLTKEELQEIIKTGRVWLVVTGMTMPPVILSGIKPFGEQ